ncbi:uncharacterized protein PAC_17757 [Phialocephala subalpina]|uniref:Heterokaryon incompatibility domain-containing protein n=1 Tax=Phialocephala subalpina TaxID=576137 RepID=A0A1L7XSB1_9HELO|nr:uncharacterized protein PAC_17757 [Phialocephala subalpina]
MLNYLTSLLSSRSGRSPTDDLSTLCQPCASIFRSQYKDKPLGVTATHNFPQTVEQLQSSAESGCHLCYIRWDDLTPKDREALRGCAKITYGFWKSKIGNGIAFEYFYPTPPATGKPYLTVSVLFKPLDEFPNPLAGGERRYEPNTNNEQTYELAASWIQTCVETHAYCNRATPLPRNRILPTRLLDVGSGPERKPKLVLTNSLPSETQYMTLSHCWGGFQPLRLTMSTFADFQDHIPWTDLPKTFQDAITTTSKLGTKYLWIDSLCIIQDSEEDWREQAATMGDVYHNSWCNIGAGAARDARDGCFMDRHKNVVRPCKIQTSWIRTKTRRSTLHSRAWVVQELVLSPRVLHFGQQLFWECLELRACETFPDGFPNNKITKTSLDIHTLRHEMLKSNNPKYQRHQLWQKLVNRYSECSITKPEVDKLVAISGLARKLIIDGDQYVAGMWREILPDQLLWCADKGEQQLMPPNDYIPSWSWASLNKKTYTSVRTEFDRTKPIVRILQAHIPLLDSDPFGQILPGGILRLEGPLLKANIRRCMGIYNNTKWWLGDSLANFFSDREPYVDGHELFLLTIRSDDSHGLYNGIALEPTGQAAGKYRRTGYFCASNVKEQDGYVQYFKALHEASLETHEYEDALGVDEGSGLPFYRISIV